MAFTFVLMSACSQDTTPKEASDKESVNDVSIKDTTPKEASNEESVSDDPIKIPEDIFVSNKKNENINEDEMKESIKNYLDYSYVIEEELETIVDEIIDSEDVTESNQENLLKLLDQANKNDANFNDFISNNHIPDDFKKPSKEINEFVTSSRAILLQLDQEIEKVFEKASLADISNFVSTHFNKANGRQQQKIEKFLDKKKIETTYFGE